MSYRSAINRQRLKPLLGLHRNHIEPAQHLGNQREVVTPAELLSQIRDVPGPDQQPPLRLARDPAHRAMRTQTLTLECQVVLETRAGFREGREEALGGVER